MPTEPQETGFFTRRNSSEGDVNPRPRWRETVAAALYHSGALLILQAFSRHYEFAPAKHLRMQLLRGASRTKFAILCYHRIGTGGIPLFSELPPKVFEAQMRFLRRWYRVVSLDELCGEMESPTRNGQAVAVTFDDGYRDLHTYALPVLQRYQIPATVFLPVMSIETGEVPWYDRVFLALRVFPKDEMEIALDHHRRFRLTSDQARLQAATEIIGYVRTLPDWRRKEYCESLETQVTLPLDELRNRMLTWDQIRAMCRVGVSFGSHTMTHPVVSRLTEEQLESEFCKSKHLLEERIGSPCQHFAFPFGKPEDCGKAAPRILTASGYRSAATTVEGANSPGDNLYELRRTQIGNERSVPMFAFKLSQLFLSAGVEDPDPALPASSPFVRMASSEPGQRQARANDA